jgi:hypothetical protein
MPILSSETAESSETADCILDMAEILSTIRILGGRPLGRIHPAAPQCGMILHAQVGIIPEK